MTDDLSAALHHRTFSNRTFQGSKFVGCDLSEVVIRGSDVAGIEIDSPWLLEGGNTLIVNGVDVVGFVDAQLNAKFPGRELRVAATAEQLREAWRAVADAWEALLSRAASMPEGSVDRSVDGEWSLAQTLRHLVMATDVWLGRAILEQEQPYHPIGLPNEDDDDTEAWEPEVFSSETPTWDEVLAARSDRQELVRRFLADLSDSELTAARRNPHNPEYPETVLSCLRTILDEEWEHLRYATRDVSARPDQQAAPQS